MTKLFNLIPLNIPNALSLYRLIMFPVILFFIYYKMEHLFVVFFVINLLTDIADGFIARHWHLETKEGAVLDSLADIGSYISAAYAILVFHPYLYTDFGIWLIVFVILFFVTMLPPLIKYGRPAAGLHLYSAKIAGYLQGIFLLTLFVFGMNSPLFYAAMITGYYSETEGMLINLIARKPMLNAKTIFHCIRSKFNPSVNDTL